jgi:hypothetical protein
MTERCVSVSVLRPGKNVWPKDDLRDAFEFRLRNFRFNDNYKPVRRDDLCLQSTSAADDGLRRRRLRSPGGDRRELVRSSVDRAVRVECAAGDVDHLLRRIRNVGNINVSSLIYCSLIFGAKSVYQPDIWSTRQIMIGK